MGTTVIRLPRGCGKTFLMLKLANERGGVIVGKHTARLREKAKYYGFDKIKDFISYGEYLNDAPNAPDPYSQYFIDNFEELAKYLPQVGAISVSTD
jgi:hypothetical protein